MPDWTPAPFSTGDPERDSAVTASLSGAEKVLGERVGSAVSLSAVELLGHGDPLVVRARIEPHPFFPARSLVVKQRGGERDGGMSPGFVREVAAYQFITSLVPTYRPGPELLAVGPAERLLILTDLGLGDSLAEAAQNADATARGRLAAALGQTLGRMHAATMGRGADHTALLHRFARTHGVRTLPRVSDMIPRVLAELPGVLEEVYGVGTPGPVRAELAELIRALDNGGLTAFNPMALHPEDILVTSTGGIRLLDYRWAGFRDIAVDVACVLQGFPLALAGADFTPEMNAHFVDAWRGEATWGRQEAEFPLGPDFEGRLLAGRAAWSVFALWLFAAPDAPRVRPQRLRPERVGYAFGELASAAGEAGRAALTEWSHAVAGVVEAAAEGERRT